MKEIPKNREINRRALYDKLLERKAFWSYGRVPYENIGDELLIEKVLEELELEDIHLLFSLYPKKRIQKVWKNELVIQDPYYRGLNLFLGKVFFNIKNPEQYIRKVQQQRLNQAEFK